MNIIRGKEFKTDEPHSFKEGQMKDIINIVERMTDSSVEVFLNEVYVGVITLYAPRHIAGKHPKWMSVWIPPKCSLISTLDCKRCKGGPCEDKVIASDCASVEEALGMLLENIDPDMVIDFSAVVWPVAFKAGNIRVPTHKSLKDTRPAPNWDDTPAPVKQEKPRVQISTAPPKLAAKPKQTSIEDALREAADHIKDGI